MLRKSISITVSLVMLFSVMPVNVSAQTKSTNPQLSQNTSYAPSFSKKQNDSSKIKPGEIIIKYKDKTTTEYKNNLEKKLLAKTIKTKKNGSKLIKVGDVNFENELKNLETDENIEYAVPNYIRCSSAL